MTDKLLKRIAKNFRSGILQGRSSEGMCATVCIPLEGFLAALGEALKAETIFFRPGCTTSENHVYLRLPDGRILDPTADQFGLEPVYLGPMPPLYLGWKVREEDMPSIYARWEKEVSA